MDASDGPTGEIHFRMSRAEAVVLSEWLHRQEDRLEELATDPAEQVVLWDVTALLERLLPEPLRQDYPDVLEAARAQVRPDPE